MKPSRRFIITGALLLALFAGHAEAATKSVFVHYRPWFAAKPFSAQWGWHWTMDHFNPDQIDATGQRQIASWYRPLIGPYDSADPAVLEYHVLLMKLAGVDGVIVDWHGPDDFLDYAANNERTKALFEQTRRAGLQFALCYEDLVVQQQVAQGQLAASNAIAKAQQTLRYAETNFFGDPTYRRLNGRPVFLNFWPQYFKSDGQWDAIFAALPPTNQPALFTVDYRVAAGAGGFSWPPMWLGLAPGTRGVLSVAALQNYLDRFDERAKTWTASISSAFTRFHDIYQSAGAQDYGGYLGDRKGQTLRETLSRALTNQSDIVQIVSWNDFGAGTMVEPTVEYGFRDLGIIQQLRRLHLDPSFSAGTNELTIPLRLYALRSTAATNGVNKSQLDAVAQAVIGGRLDAARRQLEELEARHREEQLKQNPK